MPLAETLTRWLRLRRFHVTVAKAVRDPSRIERLAESSGYDAGLIRQCVEAIIRSRMLRPANKAVTLHQIDPKLIERARRAICMLLELHVQRLDSESLDAVMNLLREALAAGDEERMTRIMRLIEYRYNMARGEEIEQYMRGREDDLWQRINQERPST